MHGFEIPLTASDRAAIQASIALHGFELCERWLSDSGCWVPFLLGEKRDAHNHCCIITDRHRRVWRDIFWTTIARPHQPLAWCELTDFELMQFYDVVLSIC